MWRSRNSRGREPEDREMTVREFFAALAFIARDAWSPTPRPDLYLHCDVCGGPTPHSSYRRIISATEVNPTLVAAPPEPVCAVCRDAHPRTLGDESPCDTAMVCVGRRRRRWRSGRSRRRCGARFEVPASAPTVICPWCSTQQDGPVRH
ncbi:hypothetical protein FRAAL4997 [Frankia alni ACN14a]|uniref:Uncharacterized protein n=1 Tax=Frankia alni (strain DSM 45986 / CECT 9034 / ACN14a) TaxID=326424 RepID=Q0RFV2_FRAAA|nr:hypothetical protein FRAAL4997 [Frankia alni ACN14a]